MMRRITFEFPDEFIPNAVWLNYVMQDENRGDLLIGIRSLDTKEIYALRDGAVTVEIDRKEAGNAND